MPTEIRLQGHCDDRFSAVRDTFEAAFESGAELGAAICVVQHGEIVVELWGGFMDAGCSESWQRDTPANVFSTAQGMTAKIGLGDVMNIMHTGAWLVDPRARNLVAAVYASQSRPVVSRTLREAGPSELRKAAHRHRPRHSSLTSLPRRGRSSRARPEERGTRW